MRTLLILASLTACATVRHPEVPASAAATAASTQPNGPQPAQGSRSATESRGIPVLLTHEAVVSARWAVPVKGVLDLDDPATADLPKADVPIVLPVHVLTHPDHGVFVVDTGVGRDIAAGGPGPARGLVKGFLSDIEAVEPLADILERQEAPLGGVLLTHVHLDHVLGLTDVPAGTPIYAGPGDLTLRSFTNALTRGTFAAAFEGHEAVRTWAFADAPSHGPVEHAIDVFGDGSLLALHVPGHTPGSTAYLARTADGAKLFTGDCSHTQWGWEHDVTPGTYTIDHDANAHSLATLKALVDAQPDIEVFVGHELGGADTGVQTLL
ncbi:MAG: MBL fold metallo-hydrolase [Myxococcales bacterium]|nr:MBL fold metallo-hydrolase [Myxococcales bacterium]